MAPLSSLSVLALVVASLQPAVVAALRPTSVGVWRAVHPAPHRTLRASSLFTSGKPTVATAPLPSGLLVGTRRRSSHPTRSGCGVLMGLFGGAPDEPVFRLRAALRGIGWFSWWAQLILSTVSGVLLLFANSVTSVPSAITLAGRLFALGGLGAALASTLWTAGYARLATRLGGDGEPTSAAKAAERALGIVKVGIGLNTLGMVLCLVGAEAIVGTLAAKALTQSTTATTATLGVIAAGPAVQALDILIVQANTNLIFSHFISLCAGLRLRGAADACAASADA